VLRIGDAERDRAAGCLGEHLAAGRLDSEEYDQRLELALTARVGADLERLFSDLPAPHPLGGDAAARAHRAASDGTGVNPVADAPANDAATPSSGCSSRRRIVAGNALLGVVWTAAITICLTRGFDFWWLLLIAFGVSATVHSRRREQLSAARRRQLPPQH